MPLSTPIYLLPDAFLLNHPTPPIITFCFVLRISGQAAMGARVGPKGSVDGMFVYLVPLFHWWAVGKDYIDKARGSR